MTKKKVKKFGIDEFIDFDKQKGEIRMSIPVDYILDPEKNKQLRTFTYEYETEEED